MFGWNGHRYTIQEENLHGIPSYLIWVSALRAIFVLEATLRNSPSPFLGETCFFITLLYADGDMRHYASIWGVLITNFN
jgi:hypothetical protein